MKNQEWYLTEAGVFDWIKNTLKNTKNWIAKSGIKPGYFFLYNYDSKLYEEGKLPFFDAKPMILCLSATPTHVLGINVHYIPIRERKRIVAKLKSLYPEQWGTNKRLPNISWGMVSHELQHAQYMLKLYLRDRIDEVVKIKPQDMENVLNVDLSDFVGIDATKVWREYRNGTAIYDRTGKPGK